MGNSNKIPDFGKIARDIVHQAPRMAGVESVKFFKDSFVNQGFTDRSITKWTVGRSPLRGKRTLFGTGNLMQSIRTKTVSSDTVQVVSDTPYSELHNNGGILTVTAQMKKYWWARYYEFSGKIKTTKRGKASRSASNKRTNSKAEFCRAMALMKVGSKIKIPARQFIGDSATLMSNLDMWVHTQIQQRFNNI